MNSHSAYANPKKVPRSIGFPKSPEMQRAEVISGPVLLAHKQTSPPQPTQLRKPPKGRLFIASVLLTLFAVVGWTVWNEFGRYRAFGLIAGKSLSISSDASGRVQQLLVAEGEVVEAGQLLIEMDVPGLTFEREKAVSELLVATANLRLRNAELQTRAHELKAQDFDRRIEYFRILGDYHLKKAELVSLEATYFANEPLNRKQVISEIELIESKAKYEGLKIQLRDMDAALKELEAYKPIGNALINEDLLLTDAERVTAIQKQIETLDKMIAATKIHSPAKGRVLRRKAQSGEFVQAGQSIIEIVALDTVEVQLFVPQNSAAFYKTGSIVSVQIPALNQSVDFIVDRIAPEVQAPPTALQNRYRAHRGVVCLHAVPLPGKRNGSRTINYELLSASIGAEVCLPTLSFQFTRNIGSESESGS